MNKLMILSAFFAVSLISSSNAQGLFWGSSAPASGGGGGLTFDQLAASNSIAIYDPTKWGFTSGTAFPNPDMTDTSGNTHNLAHANNGTYATNNSIAPELNGTNFWIYDNGPAFNTRWGPAVSVTQAQAVTAYCLMRIQSGASWNFFDLGGESLRWHNSTPGWDLNAGTQITGGSLTTGQWLWFEIQFNGGSSFAKQYPSTTLVSGNAGANGMTLIEIGDDTGHNFFYQGDIAFMSFHAGAMPSGFATQFYNAAKARFGSSVQ